MCIILMQIYTNVSLRLNNISGLITKKMKKKSRITVEQIYIDLQDKFSFSTKCMGRETFPVPNKREIRLKRKKRKKKTSTIRPIAFGEPRDNYRWVSVFSRCASRRLKNLHKHISSPRGLATRRRNK